MATLPALAAGSSTPDQLGVQGGFAPVGADLEHVVVLGVDKALADHVGPFSEVLDVVDGGGGGWDHLGFGAAGTVCTLAEVGHGQVEVVCEFDVRVGVHHA